MARRKPRGDEQTLEPVIQVMPPARTAKHREHEYDAYEAPAGAVPVTIRTEPKTPVTSTDLALRDEARADAKARGARYDAYLEARARHGTDVVGALAEVYNLPREQAEANRVALLHDVRQGLPASSTADLMEANDVGEAAQIAMLSRHMYSDVPAASLKAIDMLTERAGKTNSAGSFESFLQIVKQRQRKPA